MQTVWETIQYYAATVWDYIRSHRWSMDILRANILFIALVLIYQLVHFHLAPISWHFFWKVWLLMNVCLFIKIFFDFDGNQRQ